ncbi:hypothetical protein C8F04DRAFT_1138113 [Mycena alexandri]|uniref:Uncharacterized protein n=1 Tax=Mycena alexandri TaxID=1745969 RepID=A0AAD6S7Q0_9AGAR|nr:hypothetical protein C8F04DRAFT_1138113 [Mycena alexandri]
MVIACGFSVGQMFHQVLFTAGLLRLLRSSGGVGGAQEVPSSTQHLMQVKGVIDNVLALANNFAADSFFTYRCYVIWGDSRYRLRVIAVPLLLLVFTTIFGITNALLAPHPSTMNPVNVSLSPVYSVGVEITVGLGQILANLLLTGLAAGRIWWTRRNLRVIGETKLTQRCNTAIAMLLESSALYFGMILTFFLMGMVGSPAVVIYWGASVQLMVSAAPA